MTFTLASTNIASLGTVAIAPGNSAPNLPTALTRTDASQTTNTPSFSAAISDPDSIQQIKARFTIFQSDGTTVVGTVDSSFQTGSGTASATYGSSLSVGTYKASAQTIDDQGLSSAQTAQITFLVTQYVNRDGVYVWDNKAYTNHDAGLVWDVQASNLKDFSLLWDVWTFTSPKDLTLLWDQNTPWVNAGAAVAASWTREDEGLGN